LAKLSGERVSFRNVFLFFLHHLIRSIPDYPYQAPITRGKLGSQLMICSRARGGGVPSGAQSVCSLDVVNSIGVQGTSSPKLRGRCTRSYHRGYIWCSDSTVRWNSDFGLVKVIYGDSAHSIVFQEQRSIIRTLEVSESWKTAIALRGFDNSHVPSREPG